MKGCLLAIVQLLTIVNYSNNLIFFENNIVEQFDRYVNNFKISSLLVTKTEKFKMLRTLGSYGLSEEEKEFLNHLESKVNQTANVIKSNQFDSWINDSKYLKFCNLKEVLNDAKTGNYEFISGINIVKNYNRLLA
ncbi:hypothetical protein [Spiroplasma endosymbiont of Eupeodes luniger]|uniref:hypothetical protein n=1 Tax=Spiroplasma endosymbiont of Eupeodes luniger TaxID=3066300 RepID=UPI0030D4CEAD